MERNGLNRFIKSVSLALAIGLAWVLSFSVSGMAKDPERLLMAFAPDTQYVSGHWFLIPQPFEIVKAELEKGERTLRGFQWRDDSAPLSDMEFYWTQVSLLNRPDLQQSLSEAKATQAKPVLDRALAAGAITPEERTVFEQALQNQQDYDKDALSSHPFFSQRVARWSFYRKEGRAKKYNEIMGIVLDASPMLGRSPVSHSPMTLLWFNGWNTTARSQFKGTSEMTGVAVFPDPHFIHWNDVNEQLDPKVQASLNAAAQRLQALSDEASGQAMRGYILAYQSHDPLAGTERVPEPPALSLLLEGSELPSDECRIRYYDNHDWRMVGLPEGGVLLSGDLSHRFIRHGAQVQRGAAIPELAQVKDVKVDSSGTVWGYMEDRAAGRCFLSWQPKTGLRQSFPLPPKIGDSLRGYPWTPIPGASIAFREHSNFYSLDAQGQWAHRVWNNEPRREVSEQLGHAMPWLGSTKLITPHFADGLFWQSDKDVYGIDPRTARVTSTIRIPSAQIVFGSHAAHWGLILNSDSQGGSVRVLDEKTGRPRLEVATRLVYYPSSLARSAHGRLLALSSEISGSVLLLDLQQNKPLAVLKVPDGFTIQATAFSWNGEQLWMYAEQQMGGAQRRMFVWDVPASVVDPAQGTEIPDQLRFDLDDAH